MRPVIDRTDHDDTDALVVRVDYSDDDSWRTVVELLNQPWGEAPGIPARNRFVNHHAYAGASPDEVLAALGGHGRPPRAVFLADETTMGVDHPVLAVSTLTREDCENDDQYAEAMEFGRQFRLAPTAITEMNHHLVLGHKSFEEFAALAAAAPGRVFRGLDSAQPSTAFPRAPWDGWYRPCGRTRLRRGETFRDASLVSPNGRYEFSSSNGVFFLREQGEVVWLGGLSQVPGTGLYLDDDGELQLRTTRGHGTPMIPDFEHLQGKRPRWPKTPDGKSAPARGVHSLVVRDDGDIDLVDENDRTLWSFETAHHVRQAQELRDRAFTPPLPPEDEPVAARSRRPE
jgi:hypothetical protein